MKTIKEAIVAKKTEILNGLFKTKDGLSWNETSELINELVELAQRWIPVEEELPGKIDDGGFSEQVLVKSHGNTYQVKRYDHELHRWTGDIYFIPVAWRPIELK